MVGIRILSGKINSRFLPLLASGFGMTRGSRFLPSVGMTKLGQRFSGAGVDVHYVIRLFREDQVPGFAVFFEAHLFGLAVGVEAEHGRGGADFDGDDVPDVERDDVGGDEVDVFLGVDGAAFADGVGGAGFVGAGADGVGAFDLNAVEAVSVVEDEVVAAAVAPGLGDAEVPAGWRGRGRRLRSALR